MFTYKNGFFGLSFVFAALIIYYGFSKTKTLKTRYVRTNITYRRFKKMGYSKPNAYAKGFYYSQDKRFGKYPFRKKNSEWVDRKFSGVQKNKFYN